MLALIVVGGISHASALARTKDHQEKFSVSQTGQTPNFVVTDNTKKIKTVDLVFDLVNKQGRTEYSYVQNGQTFAAGDSHTYSMGPLTLTPSGSPYHVVFSVFKANKKHKLIERVDPAGSFTVVH